MQALEERGIGRPSTYASIMGTILDRGYVFKRGTALVPVVPRVRRHRPARAALRPARRLRVHGPDGGRPRPDRRRRRGARRLAAPLLLRRRRRDGDAGLHALVSDHLGEIDARAVNSIPIGDSGIVLRVGRYGPYVERGEERASVPEDIAPDELTVEKAEELLAAPSGDRSLGVASGVGTRDRRSRPAATGPYVTEVLPEGATEKPRTASLFQSMSPETVTLDDALRLLSLPRDARYRPRDGEEVTAQNGRYGPYVKKGDGVALARDRGAAVHDHARGRAGAARPAEAAARPRPGEAAAARARRRIPVSGKPVVAEGGPLRPLRHRRRDEREPAPRRRSRDGDDRARGGAARRPAVEGPRAEAQAQRRQAFGRVVRTNLQTFQRQLSSVLYEGAIRRASVARAKTDSRPSPE